MYKQITRVFSDNIYLIIGLCIGFYLASPKLDATNTICNELETENVEKIIETEPLKIVKKPLSTPSNAKKPKPIRPRYYSTELGIRQKLFVGIFTSEDRINANAVPINKTIGHLVDQIKFFITAQYKMKNKINLSGIVGFTDTRPRYRPFQVLKYIGDNFAQEYDYYFLAQDYSFVNAHKLNDLVEKISVRMDVYLGETAPDASYCNLDAGVILSASVMKAVREHLDWCVIHALSDDPGENVGRCIHHSIGLSCQNAIQSRSYDSFKLKHFDLQRHLYNLTQRADFSRAVTIYPVVNADQVYQLNAYFLKERLKWIQREIERLDGGLALWPPGRSAGAKAASRFDLPKQYYFNASHIFHPDDFTNVRKHSELELMDLQNILTEIRATVPGFQYKSLINGYKKFDLSRGYDYIFDLEFTDSLGNLVSKRFEVSKPLSKVEFIATVPYVTETGRVNVIVSVELPHLEQASEFLRTWIENYVERKDKTFLLLVLLYPSQTSSKGDSDVFKVLKEAVLKVASRYKDEVKMAWLSIRLPPAVNDLSLETHPCLRFAIVDLALRKIGLESLVLVLDPYANITMDFLNRVRMNTIPNYQVFSPIPYKQYNPKVSLLPTLEINKNCGRFDAEDFSYISFYSQDYVDARRKYARYLPIVKANPDVDRMVSDCQLGNIFEMFVKMAPHVHAMRATEMGLKVKYSGSERFLGNQGQLGSLLVSKSEQIKEL